MRNLIEVIEALAVGLSSVLAVIYIIEDDLPTATFYMVTILILTKEK